MEPIIFIRKAKKQAEISVALANGRAVIDSRPWALRRLKLISTVSILPIRPVQPAAVFHFTAGRPGLLSADALYLACPAYAGLFWRGPAS